MECCYSSNCKKLHCDDENGCLIKIKLDSLFDEALMTEKQRYKTVLRTDNDGTDRAEFLELVKIQNNIKEEVENGLQLYLHSSNAGNGKTSWAIRLMQQYFKSIWLSTSLKCRGLFISVPMFLLELKNNISERSEYIAHIRENMLSADLIIWDDIATKAATPYEAENLFSIIDARIGAGKANIFTSNLNDEELHKALGDRLASRICRLGRNIELHGGDKRGTVE